MQRWVRARPLALPKRGSQPSQPRSFASGTISRYESQDKRRENRDDLDEATDFEAFDRRDPFAEFRRDDPTIKTIPHRGGRKAYDSNFDDGTWHIRFGETDQNLNPLPLPPFLWRNPDVKSSLTRHDYPGRYKPEGPGTGIKTNLKRAEFSTHLAQNPYAAALAKPVRSCTFSGNRLPTSCLIDFHVVTRGAKGTTDLLPLSINAALVPKKAHETWIKGQRGAVEAATSEEESIAPTGSATYMTCQKKALDFVNEDLRKRLIRMAVNSRLRNSLGSSGLHKLRWREDMPDYILRQLRRAVLKSLRYWFTQKGQNVENPGLLRALPGTLSGEGGGPSGLARLDEVDDVMCVLKLTPTDKTKITPRYNLNRKNAEQTHIQVEPVSRDYNLDNLTPAIKGENDTQILDNGAQHNATTTATTSFESSSTSDTTNDINTKTRPDLPETAPSVKTPTTNESTTYITKTSWWSARLPNFISPITKPLQPAPGSPASTLHFPTVPYRNRRIPLYHLHHMLGEEYMQNLVHKTHFSAKGKDGSGLEQNQAEQAGDIASIDYVIVSRHTSTVQAQMWLMKLAGYVAKPKNEPF